MSSPARKSSTVSGGKDGFVDTEHEQSLGFQQVSICITIYVVPVLGEVTTAGASEPHARPIAMVCQIEVSNCGAMTSRARRDHFDALSVTAPGEGPTVPGVWIAV